MGKVNGSGAGGMPRVVVVGNHKGGCGKSTVAVHVIVALLMRGKRVAALDLDVEQHTLTRYLENRRAWSRQYATPLPLPEIFRAEDMSGLRFGRDMLADAAAFAVAVAKLKSRFDFIVVDTPGGATYLSIIAHSIADTLLTPMNDSFVDLDLIGTIGPSSALAPRRARYRETVNKARDLRARVTGAPIDWIVICNRLCAQYSRNERQVREMIEAMAGEIGFRSVRGLAERVIYREFFPVGLTAFDPLDENALGLKPARAHLAARSEVRDLVSAIGLIARDAEPETADERVERTVNMVAAMRLPPAPQLVARGSERIAAKR
ncbi:MAG: AAA family ATPase [Proteobacteria bacterium]|nr:AAA family ATPase [Pseudomonadota bacterium]